MTKTTSPTPRRHASSIRAWLKQLVLILVLIAVAWFIVIPQYDEASREIESLKNVSIVLVIVAALLEAGSLVSYSLLTAVVLGRVRPHFFTILRIDLTDLGVNHIAPGGGTTAAAVRFGLLKEAGVASTTALAAASIEIIISNLMLGLVFLAGIILSLSSLAYNKYYVATAVIVAIIIAVATVMGWLISKHTQLVVKSVLLFAKRFSRQNRIKAEEYITTMTKALNRIKSSRKQVGAVVVLGLLNWVLDAASLWVILAAFGHPLPVGSLLVAYGAANILSLLPITPGGLGIVEGVLVPSLVGFGVPGAIALVSVIGWRVLEYWLPIPVSLISYLTLKLGPLKKRSRKHNAKLT